MVLEFSVAGFRQQQTKTRSNNRDAAVDQHRDDAVVNVQEPDHRSQDSSHTRTHGVQAYAVLPVRTENGQVVR